MLKDRKVRILPRPLLFDVPARGNPLEFLDKTYPAKTRGMGLPHGENFIILSSAVFEIIGSLMAKNRQFCLL